MVDSISFSSLPALVRRRSLSTPVMPRKPIVVTPGLKSSAFGLAKGVHYQAYALPRFSAANTTPVVKEAPAQTQSGAAAENAEAQADALLSKITTDTKVKFKETKPMMSLKEFISLVYQDPYKYLPTASHYAVRGLKSFGTENKRVMGEDVVAHKFVKAPWKSQALNEIPGLLGQDEVISQIIETLEDFSRTGKQNRMILLVGPKGSGKSETWRLVSKALELYSHRPEGVRYTLNWVFPKSNPFDIIRPLMTEDDYNQWEKTKQGSSTVLSPKNIGALLESNLNIHPLFLLPVQDREALIQDLHRRGKIQNTAEFSYFINGKLDSYSQKILDALTEHYDGDMSKVFNHVMVERWTMSEQSGKGLGMVPPAANRDAMLKQVTPDVRWDRFPAFLQRAGLMKLVGALPNANGGLFNMEDMGRNMDPTRYVYLLITGETGETIIDTHGQDDASTVREQLDVVFVGSANPESILKMMKEGQWDALSKRTKLIYVPYLRQYREEAQIYEPLLANQRQRGRKIDPFVNEAFPLFLTTTRLLPVNADNAAYKKVNSDELTEGLKKLDPLRKALLYQGEDLNSFESSPNKVPPFERRIQEALHDHVALVKHEHDPDSRSDIVSNFEGSHGIDPREGEDLMKRILNYDPESPVTVLTMFQALADVVKTDMKYQQDLVQAIKMDPNFFGKFQKPGAKKDESPAFVPTPIDLLKMVEGHMRRKMQVEIKEALKVYHEPKIYADQIRKYMAHVEARNNTTEIDDPELRSPTSTDKTPDPNFMKRIELIIAPSAVKSDKDLETFRLEMMGRQKRWDRSQSVQDNILRIYEPEVKTLMTHDETKFQEHLDRLLADLPKVLRNPNIYDNQADKKDHVEQILGGIAKLTERGIPKEALPQMVEWAFDPARNFISDGTFKIRRPSQS